jgi:hypothetical protein
MAFGLLHKTPRADLTRSEAAEMLGISQLLDHKPSNCPTAHASAP